jgi:hypothetical protein
MLINFESGLTDFDGKVMPNASGQPATLKGIAIDALMASYQGEDKLSGEEKMNRFLLAEKIHKGEFDLTVEEIAMLKTLIGKAFTPIVVGQAWRILEGK